jgi:predicted DNA-binding transcriptional regulator AlpA
MPKCLLPFSPRHLSRVLASAYVGVSPNTFDVLVLEGTMPPPRRIGRRRKVWLVPELDVASDNLPRVGK